MSTFSPTLASTPAALSLDRRSPSIFDPQADRGEDSRADDIRNERILSTALKRFALVEDFERDWRTRAMEALKFRYGDQWDPDVIRTRTSGSHPRPILTLNLIPKFLRQITNQSRQQRPSINVSPVDNTADIDTANAFKGIIRHIEYASSASDAYDWAREMAATMGKGWIRVRRDYEDAYSFQQSISIDRVLNPFSIYPDPAGRQTPDYRMMDWLFEVDMMAKDLFCQKYEIDPVLYGRWASYGDSWVTKDEVRIANYWCKEHQPILLFELRYPDGTPQLRWLPLQSRDNGTTTEPDKIILQAVTQRLLDKGILPLMAEKEAPLVTRQRRSDVEILCCCKINGHTVLEKQVSPGQYIPYVPMLGEEILNDGKIDWRGIVYDMIGAQQRVNFWVTMEAETVMLAPRAAYVGAVEQFENRPEWATANIIPRSYLAYNIAMAPNGQPLPPPQREVAEPPIQAIAMAVMQAQQNLNDISGMYPPTLGEGKQAESGTARKALQQQSQLGNSHYFGNEVRTIHHLGRILVDLIPQTYVEPDRNIRMLDDDGSQEIVQLNSLLPGPKADVPRAQLPKGIEGIYNLNVGKYDVVTDVGPSYQTKREEQATHLEELAKAIPKVGDIGAHIIVGAQDFEGKDELARMLKKMVPPQLLDDEDQNQKPEDQVMMLQSQMRQMQQAMQALNAHAHQMEQAVGQLTQENKDLKAGHDLDAQKLMMDQQKAIAELDLKRRQLQIENDVAMDKIAVEHQKLDLEREKIDVQREALKAKNQESPAT